ncbi:MAG: D-aminoacyl-tRNA deacylase [Flavobacteriaceae bacterium]|nr:D-aminoacyl-tRNA deacylase [Flavobacteriaceae bacterium]MDG1966369.1 D-aminoacyl-tRNA deacylase [Flavobacteriaceae bacterium]
MRIVIQRVRQAEVKVAGAIVGSIRKGLLVFLGIENEDDQSDVAWLVNKLVNLRIFNDKNDVMNHSLMEEEGALLVISQFTLMASTKKGNRPSYIRSARHEIAIALYEHFVTLAEEKLGKKVAKGVFGADMKVSLLNDGPITIIIDSKTME